MGSVSAMALLVSALPGYSRGVEGAVTMFALAAGGVITGLLESLTRRRRRTGVPIMLLVANFILTAMGAWLLTGLIPR